MNDLKIEYLALDELKPYEKNARLHNEKDIQTIKNSIIKFGMCDPIGIWSDNNIIVEGHGRLLALKELGETTAPCIRLDHLTEEQRRGYALAHNKTAEMSTWDFEMLDLELADIVDIDMEDFGFLGHIEIDWAGVEDLDEKSYEEPKKTLLQCPHCNHVDSKNHFMKVEE